MASENPWRKAPPDLVERFEAAVAGIEGLETRKMFGFPAGFIGGHMVTGLHQESWIVRLPEEVHEERLAGGWSVFEPMPGRPMRGYVGLPAGVIADPDAARTWVERAADHVRGMPPKPPRAAKKRRQPKGG
jgi:TfoX/Sxy family transcriptional regulator of competence genes